MQLITIFNKSDTRSNDKKSSRNIRVRVNGQIVNNLRFADDIDLITETIEVLQDITDKVNESSKRFGLEINKQKTKVMSVEKKRCNMKISLENTELEQVSNFVYLGGLMTEDGKCRYKKRIGLTSTMAGKLNKIWKAKDVSNTTKVRLHETFVVPVLLYESECWCLRKEDERKIIHIL